MTKEEEIYIASRLGDMCVHLSSVVMEIVEQMITYCKEHDIRIEYNERKQWNMLIKCTKNLDAIQKKCEDVCSPYEVNTS